MLTHPQQCMPTAHETDIFNCCLLQ